jgi:tol-pal system protein YbgF
MKKLAVLLIAFTVACASADAPDPIVVSPSAPPDPRVGELQTQLTELLERLDVMNSRLARIEERESAAPASSVAAPAVRTPQIAAPHEAAAPAAQQQPQRALVGAQLAEDYRQAIMLFGRGRHADARRAFEAVLAAEPAGDLADNALFWIGETWYAVGEFTNAMRYYGRVVSEFPDQNKAPDALFKSALSQAKTGDLALARKTLQQVIDRYPYSSTASSAKAELQRIKY